MFSEGKERQASRITSNPQQQKQQEVDIINQEMNYSNNFNHQNSEQPKTLLLRVRKISSGVWHNKNSSITILDELVPDVMEETTLVDCGDSISESSSQTSATDTEESSAAESFYQQELQGETISEEENNLFADNMRHELTPWERNSVIRLKRACDMEGIKYRHVFELAKYVLVVKSQVHDDDPDVDNKRLDLALKRITKKRAWEEEFGFYNVVNDGNKMDVLRDFERAVPGYFVVRFLRDKAGRRCIGRHAGLTPAKYIQSSEENTQKWLFLEQWNFDIAGYDMVEVRRGQSVSVISEDKVTTFARAYRSSKYFYTVKSKFIREQHAYRIGTLYAHGPSVFSSLIRTVVKLLPNKISDRLKLVDQMSDLDQYIDEKGGEADNTNSVLNWFADNDEAYNETVEQLKL